MKPNQGAHRLWLVGTRNKPWKSTIWIHVPVTSRRNRRHLHCATSRSESVPPRRSSRAKSPPEILERRSATEGLGSILEKAVAKAEKTQQLVLVRRDATLLQRLFRDCRCRHLQTYQVFSRSWTRPHLGPSHLFGHGAFLHGLFQRSNPWSRQTCRQPYMN